MLGAIFAFRTLGALVGAVVVPRLYAMGAAWCFGVTSGILLLGTGGMALALVIARRREAGLPEPKPT
ncbi:hypothetical protein D3C87_2037010 [compost metagenome]